MPAALLSVTDKSGLIPFARGLLELGYTLLSTGGTAKLLREHGLQVQDVAVYTGSPEIMDGRVKTLHPKVHGGILMDRSNPQHLVEANAHAISPIDLVVVNLYRFKEEALANNLAPEAAIEFIDIGGPTMLRAAAKNWQHCLAVVDPSDYQKVLSALRERELVPALRRQLAAKVFRATSQYDAMIGEFLTEPPTTALPEKTQLDLDKVQPLRYGENPHQNAAFYAPSHLPRSGFASAPLLQGKELSYNNILDLEAATALVSDLSNPAVVIVKHTNPCGVATGDRPQLQLYEQALACDPKSAFGGIVAFNRPLTAATAKALTGIFLECVAAPGIESEAQQILKAKPNLRVLVADFAASGAAQQPRLGWRSVQGGFLIQDVDITTTDPARWQVMTQKSPTATQSADLCFAMTVAKHVKSNAIVFVKDGLTFGIGAGQMSRIDSAHAAVAKAKECGRSLSGTVMASEAFFPFRDTVEFAASLGITAIVQPGGSLRDQESIEAANAAGIVMVFTGVRHFRH